MAGQSVIGINGSKFARGVSRALPRETLAGRDGGTHQFGLAPAGQLKDVAVGLGEVPLS